MARRRPFIAVYIMANFRNGAIYTGVTSDLGSRVLQHKRGSFGGFTSLHGCRMLVWYEKFETMKSAIAREKAMKHWYRDWKTALIETDNAEWRDLSDGWYPYESGVYE